VSVLVLRICALKLILKLITSNECNAQGAPSITLNRIVEPSDCRNLGLSAYNHINKEATASCHKLSNKLREANKILLASKLSSIFVFVYLCTVRISHRHFVGRSGSLCYSIRTCL